MTGNPVGLVEFLLARYADIEAAARAAQDRKPTYGHLGETAHAEVCELASGEGAADEAVAFVKLLTPQAVLADIAAKRRIIEAAQSYSPELEHGDNGEWAFDRVLRLLAAPFSSHPDWQPEWSTE